MRAPVPFVAPPMPVVASPVIRDDVALDAIAPATWNALAGEPAVSLPCVPVGAAHDRLRDTAHRLEAALPDRLARPGAGRRAAAVRKGAQLRRIRVRLGLGGSLSAARPPLLSETRWRRFRSRRCRARACWRADAVTRRALLEYALDAVHRGALLVAARAVPARRGSGRRRGAGHDPAPGRPVSLDQSGLSRLRRFPRRASRTTSARR